MTEIKPATDEQIAAMEPIYEQPATDEQIEKWTASAKCRTGGPFAIRDGQMLSLIARIRAEREWQPIETAPHACTFLATYWSDDFGEWTVGLVMRPLDGPWTHWRPLPTPPALSQEERT